MSDTELEDLSAEEVAEALDAGRIVLIDVREPHEYAAERIAGALLMPLSTFEPEALPTGGDKRIVLHCAAGKRSERAAQLAAQAGVRVDAHLAGGLSAWKDAGFETLAIQPSTGQMVRVRN
ncbi:rhodanese-like domain-containing protein [Marinicauda algicola]|uniref:Rhodanese-like domain-containing protein n=1 Tax=Marinicauda algicola TaxID=2029849 RepID=A0A4S2GY63_9PROT|nr:rhodanese-like domain-containing protein [Marinicauda algicola]TGY87821.1 rhodanese-like domain-containing protein [Marinicauda algicola]